ncbi:hypothetical protein CSPB12327_00755 [Campylobacter sp. RM12327]|uniref:hypothetical protein n=1 Tax=Campylobacter sputorum TaxID=206 RepID=UPI00187AF1EC|nr:MULTISPECIES: hypothetical protein [Campylobacter]ASM40351.1 putative lipoprotein [Campylobacter sputorum]MBE7357376.1 hypothetical protein [Campylobacter sp. RM11302]MBF6668686.1 hypothetical protein [Campylobacter sp. RM12327]MBF6674058.1 hypothetical protein [Campylobacter sp. RM13538]MBF6675527.1 hypothetical protein [Campylobacter sp. RM12321]
MKNLLTIIVVLFFTACSIKNTPQSSSSVFFTINSPNLKISDAGFIHYYNNYTTLQIYNSGVSILKLDIKDKICINSACSNKIDFNKKYLLESHYDSFLNDIINQKPIYEKESLIKTDCGFKQNISKNSIEYEVCNNKSIFKDTKNNITIVLRLIK